MHFSQIGYNTVVIASQLLRHAPFKCVFPQHPPQKSLSECQEPRLSICFLTKDLKIISNGLNNASVAAFRHL